MKLSKSKADDEFVPYNLTIKVENTGDEVFLRQLARVITSEFPRVALTDRTKAFVKFLEEVGR